MGANTVITVEERDKERVISNLAVESGSLALSMMYEECADAAVEKLTPEDFYWPHHQVIFDVIRDLFKQNRHIDHNIVSDELQKRGKLEEAKGKVYVSNLVDLAPAKEATDEYIKAIQGWSLLREIDEGARETHSRITLGYLSDPLEAINQLGTRLDKATTRLRRAKVETVASICDEILGDIARAMATGIDESGIPTGFEGFDDLTGGVQPGENLVVAARTSVGKTAFVLQMAAQIAINQKKPALIFSLEMPKKKLMFRLICSYAKVNSRDARRGKITQEQYDKMQEAAKMLSECPLLIDDNTSATLIEMMAATKKLIRDHGELGCVVIDNLPLVSPTNPGADGHVQTAELSRGLNRFCMDVGVPLVTVTQLNRATEEKTDKKPTLSNIAGSDCVARDAATVALLWRPEYYDDKVAKTQQQERYVNAKREEQRQLITPQPLVVPEQKTVVIVDKQRNGPTGTFNLWFDMNCSYFSDKPTMESFSYTDDKRNDFFD